MIHTQPIFIATIPRQLINPITGIFPLRTSIAQSPFWSLYQYWLLVYFALHSLVITMSMAALFTYAVRRSWATAHLFKLICRTAIFCSEGGGTIMAFCTRSVVSYNGHHIINWILEFLFLGINHDRVRTSSFGSMDALSLFS